MGLGWGMGKGRAGEGLWLRVAQGAGLSASTSTRRQAPPGGQGARARGGYERSRWWVCARTNQESVTRTSIVADRSRQKRTCFGVSFLFDENEGSIKAGKFDE